MAQVKALIIDSDTGTVRRLIDALSSRVLASAIHKPDGESAVRWIGVNDCDLCIISYELPGIDGLETLARMRSRKPNLPFIMFARSESQDVAIAAFRAGVIDFVPLRGAATQAIADVAAQAIERGSAESSPMAASTVDSRIEDVPAQRLEPTYQNRLRAIGRQLDIYDYRSVTVLEVEGGFLVRALPARRRNAQVLEFSDRDLRQLIVGSILTRSNELEDGRNRPSNELTPTGYEDFFRALGYKLDQMVAESVVIVELDDVIVVGGRGRSDVRLAPTFDPFHMFLREEEVDSMLNEAFSRRGQAVEPAAFRQKSNSGGLRGILKRLN